MTNQLYIYFRIVNPSINLGTEVPLKNVKVRYYFNTVTPVFEGLCRDLGIVVDYKDRQGLVLLSVINNKTGEEPEPIALVNAGDGVQH